MAKKQTEKKAEKVEVSEAAEALEEMAAPEPVVEDALPVVVPRYALNTDGPIYTFKDPLIQGAVNRAIQDGGQGRKLVVVATADLEGASLSIVCRVGDQWSVMAGGFKKWSGELNAEAKIVFSPF